MIKAYTLHTTEIDDLAAAQSDIAAQLGSLPLLQHSVGILVCHYDYVSGGIAEAVCQSLPFPSVGITTFYQAATGASGLFGLTITVLTSSSVRFAVACSQPNDESLPAPTAVKSTYQAAYNTYGEKPSLIFSFLSVNRPISGDEYLCLLDEYSGGVPQFGAVTTGDDEVGTNVYVFCNGVASYWGCAVLLFIGPVDAGFYFGNYKEDKLLEMTATVTAAEGERVLQLNGQPAVSYLRKSGFVLDDAERDRISNIPLLFKAPGSGALIARTLAGFDGDGAIKCLGEIPAGSLLRVGTVSMEDTLDTSLETMRRAVDENPNAAAFFIFSCVGRYITLGMDPTSEMESVTREIPAQSCYMACYAGGEICPTGPGTGKNCYHNASFVVCALN